MAFDPRLLKRWEYTVLLGFSVFSMLGYFILIFSLADFTNSVGQNSSQASVASALFNIGQAIGRPLIGYFSDKTGHINMAGSMTFLAGVLPLVIWTNTKSYGELIFFAIVEGLVAGNFWATIASSSCRRSRRAGERALWPQPHLASHRRTMHFQSTDCVGNFHRYWKLPRYAAVHGFHVHYDCGVYVGPAWMENRAHYAVGHWD